VITPRAVFLERLHYNPVQVARQKIDEFGSLRLTASGGGGQVVFEHRVQAGGRAHRFLLPDGAAHRVQTGSEELSCVEWCLAGKQFVKEDAQTVDIAAGIN